MKWALSSTSAWSCIFFKCKILEHEHFTQINPTDACWPGNVTFQTEVTEHAEDAKKRDENVI